MKALLLTLAASAAYAQTGISVTQIVCPATPAFVSAFIAVAVAPAPGTTKPFKFSCMAIDPKSITIDVSTNPPTLRVVGGGSTPAGPVFIDGEVPAGNIDGTTLSFTLTAAPSPASSLRVYRNGVKLAQGTDYALVGPVITFVQGAQPQVGDSLTTDYRR